MMRRFIKMAEVPVLGASTRREIWINADYVLCVRELVGWPSFAAVSIDKGDGDFVIVDQDVATVMRSLAAD